MYLDILFLAPIPISILFSVYINSHTTQHFNEVLTDILNNCNFSNFSKVLMYAP
jgi:hypothetical protein